MTAKEKLIQLREETGVSIIECKKAIEEASGYIPKAKEILRKWGQSLAGKKTSREVKEGIIESYIHSNKKIGVLLELSCESDFVARSEEFRKLARELCLQIAAFKPLFLKENDVPEDLIVKEKEIYKAQLVNSGKPERLINQIVDGKIKKYKEEISLLSQLWIKDSAKTVGDLISDAVAKIGENIVVKRFTRYEI
ncbi:MAG: translation elongation factor Ts [Patescibacteria group bacterium]